MINGMSDYPVRITCGFSHVVGLGEDVSIDLSVVEWKRYDDGPVATSYFLAGESIDSDVEQHPRGQSAVG